MILKACEVKGKQGIDSLKKTLKEWKITAKHRMKLASSSSAINDQKKFTCSLSYTIIRTLLKELKKRPKERSIYVTYDETMKVQAVALASLQKGCNRLSLIATHPENIPIFGYEQGVKGAASAIVSTIAKEILQKKSGCKKLHLDAFEAAMPFYEKLGFVRDTKKEQRRDEAIHLMLKRHTMKQLP